VSDNPMESGWFYLRPPAQGGGQAGPLSWQQLVLTARSGALGPGDLVWHQSLPGWLPAAQVTGLFPPAVYGVAPVRTASAGAGPTRKSGRSRLVWIMPLVTVVVVGAAIGILLGTRDRGDHRALTASSTTTSAVVSTTASTLPPTTISTVAGQPDTWTVMMYEDADDEILEEDMCFDVNEAESVGSNDQVKIVAQLDRYSGGYSGDGDVTSARRYLLTKDADLNTLTSPVLADLGEVDMGDGQTLYDFATWAIQTYPAEHYVLILSDHGGGWTGGWTDDDPTDGSDLTVQEIDDALAAIVADTGIGSFELVGFDACLMGQLEVMSVVAPHAKYAVGSEETEPSVGWGYAGFLTALEQNTSMTGRELGQAIVDSYIQEDARVTDDAARRSLTGGDYTEASVAAPVMRDTTKSARDHRRPQRSRERPRPRSRGHRSGAGGSGARVHAVFRHRLRRGQRPLVHRPGALRGPGAREHRRPGRRPGGAPGEDRAGSDRGRGEARRR
jgi:hypothetical protein